MAKFFDHEGTGYVDGEHFIRWFLRSGNRHREASTPPFGSSTGDRGRVVSANPTARPSLPPSGGRRVSRTRPCEAGKTGGTIGPCPEMSPPRESHAPTTAVDLSGFWGRGRGRDLDRPSGPLQCSQLPAGCWPRTHTGIRCRALVILLLPRCTPAVAASCTRGGRQRRLERQQAERDEEQRQQRERQQQELARCKAANEAAISVGFTPDDREEVLATLSRVALSYLQQRRGASTASGGKLAGLDPA